MSKITPSRSPKKSPRSRGGRADNRVERPEPSNFDELVICDIEQLPEGQALETAMHPKRMRRRKPSNQTKRARLQSPPTPPSILVPPSSPASSVPSLAVVVKCESLGSISSSLPASPMQPPSTPSTPSTSRVRQFRDKDNAEFINNGSDDDTDENDDEDLAIPLISRILRNLMETPLDQDVVDENFDSDPTCAADTSVDELAPVDDSSTMKMQPTGLFDFDWREFPNPPIKPGLRRETFSQINVGPTTPCADPYDIFLEIWDKPIMEHIASETNKYAQQLASQLLENHNLHPRSRISRWHDTTPDELYVYFALILAMGIVVKSRMEEYWSSTADIFYTPGFSAYMSIDRFLILNKCLHFNDNYMCAQGLDDPDARLFKIQPILSHLNSKFQSMYTPSQNISLDESLLMWKGCFEFSQLIPNKAANRGIKTYEICESQTGYLWRFEVHTTKSLPQQFKDPLEAPIPAIVLRLIQGLEHKGYTLWMDNYYQSPCLARRLKCLGFDCVGTLRTDRKFVPQAMNNLTKRNMRPGQITGLTSGDIDVLVWRDNNRVAMISTYHGNGQQIVQETRKPILIVDYNIMMGGVDKKDQLLAMYPVERKRTKVWYKKLFRRLLNVSVLNSYVICHHSSSIKHRNFRMTLVKSLLAKHSTPSPIPLIPKQGKVDITHRLGMLPMGNHQRKRRACAACKKLVSTLCVGCEKTTCMGPCFLKIHS